MTSGCGSLGLAERLADPPVILVDPTARLEPTLRLRALVPLDRVEWSPVDVHVADEPVPVGLVRNRVGERVAELEDLGHVPIEEFLPQVLVGARLDLPSQQQV